MRRPSRFVMILAASVFTTGAGRAAAPAPESQPDSASHTLHIDLNVDILSDSGMIVVTALFPFKKTDLDGNLIGFGLDTGFKIEKCSGASGASLQFPRDGISCEVAE